MSIEAISYGFADRSLFHFRYLQNGESDLVEELVLRVGQTIQPMTMRCEHSGKPLQPGFHSCLCRPAARLSANTCNNATIGAPHRCQYRQACAGGQITEELFKESGVFHSALIGLLYRSALPIRHCYSSPCMQSHMSHKRVRRSSGSSICKRYCFCGRPMGSSSARRPLTHTASS